MHSIQIPSNLQSILNLPSVAKDLSGSIPAKTNSGNWIVTAYRPEKDNPRHIRFTVGGNLIHYLRQTITKAVNLLTVKLLVKSVLLTPRAKFMTIDQKDFYLNTPMEEYE
mmetsp:Transcript_37053/g.52341  ORF Transcript_37053/g.52341 Transcript_37053/m.52341 type:complete len:110 (-) Transcript_37053:1125-1454(-)